MIIAIPSRFSAASVRPEIFDFLLAKTKALGSLATACPPSLSVYLV
jgi:hypothetical protein